MKLYLPDLTVMQADLRHWRDIPLMAQYVRDGGFWTPNYLSEFSKDKRLTRVSPVIAISRFEDGKDYVHDGHHRCVATLLGGRNYLRDDEFTLTNWNYEDYSEIAPQNNWYTPFDPKTHVRTADFGKFKAEARQRFKDDPLTAVEWLYENFDEFRVRRTLKTVADMAAIIPSEILV